MYNRGLRCGSFPSNIIGDYIVAEGIEKKKKTSCLNCSVANMRNGVAKCGGSCDTRVAIDLVVESKGLVFLSIVVHGN